MRGIAGITALLVATAPASAIAEDSGSPESRVITLLKEEPSNAKIFTFDYTIPTSPALALAGLSADKTPTSTSLKPFVVALPDFFTGSAKGQSMALDISPAAMAMPSTTYGEYKAMGEDMLQLAMFHSRLGVAAYRGVEDADATKAKASKLAIGYSTSLLKDSSPFFAKKHGASSSVWDVCTGKALEIEPTYSVEFYTAQKAYVDARQKDGQLDSVIEAISANPAWVQRPGNKAKVDALLGPGASEGPIDTILAALRAERAKTDPDAKKKFDAMNELLAKESKKVFAPILKACRDAANAEAQVGYDLDVGFGAIWNGRPENFDHFGKGGGAVWAAYKQPLYISRDKNGVPKSSLMIGGSGRYAWRESVATGDKTTSSILADTLDVWAGLELVDPKYKLAFQYGWFEADARDKALDHFSQDGERWLATAAVRVAKKAGIWGNISYGVADGTTDARDDKKVLITLTWAPPTTFDIFD